MVCSSILGVNYRLFVLQHGFSFRMLFSRRPTSECTMCDSRSSIFRVSDGYGLKIIRQYGSRRNQIILSAILNYSYLSTCLSIQGVNRPTNSTYRNRSRAFCRLFVISPICFNVFLLYVWYVCYVIFGTFRRVKYSMVSTINGNHSRINSLREDRYCLSLPS